MGKLTDALDHPEEIWPLVQMYAAARKAKAQTRGSPDWDFCYSLLNAVSRSFSIVIQQLPPQLRDAVCIFYLVLRALDTIEDDMTIPVDVKVPELVKFHTRLRDREWKYVCGEKDYRRLMLNYPLVTQAFLQLDSVHQEVITDIARRMGKGMAEFIERDVETVQDYDLYCHYVAGLTGLGLVHLFKASRLEHGDLPDDLANSMGLFLQKTNIIRDYLEDINEEPAPRMFWPKEIWGKYGRVLEDFKDPANSAAAVQCLNHLVLNVMRHAVRSLEFLSRLQDIQVFRFCAIPQVMAIGTLAECFNNPQVFTGVVKMRRGETAKYMVSINSMRNVYLAFAHFACIMIKKCNGPAQNDPHATELHVVLNEVLERCGEGLNVQPAKLQADGLRGILGKAATRPAIALSSIVLILASVVTLLVVYGILADLWRSSQQYN
ncbi:hypothetical protein WJX73_009521 [Symbiochloris irregularis]|uniref:squalene synthase n=1 Tax=Symbiochloris irregularis TaxID=706552 RepID=A0AAW1NM05_9CHLO